jgi:hypothetical protein
MIPLHPAMLDASPQGALRRIRHAMGAREFLDFFVLKVSPAFASLCVSVPLWLMVSGFKGSQ